MEIWLPIPNYEHQYQISSYGRIKSIGNNFSRKEKLLKFEYKDGYPRVNLYKNKIPKRFYVHRLVALTFIENPHNLPWVNHKDENRGNSNVLNLEWCSGRYNYQYSAFGKQLSFEF